MNMKAESNDKKKTINQQKDELSMRKTLPSIWYS
jgi:hypothetical protein